MTNSHHTEATILDTITTKDQNTGRPVVWVIEHANTCTPTKRYPWTHQLTLRRQKGSVLYIMDAIFIGDVVVEHTPARRFM